MPSPGPSPLPHTDTKPVGAADFYYGINASFRFILNRLGRAAWVQYLGDLGCGYFEPVNRQWREGGLGAVARYWRAFFAAEPGSQVTVTEHRDRVEIDVQVCPAIKHLRAGGREILREYCQHCYFLGAARAEAADLTMRLSGGNGSCRHVYARPEAKLAPQTLRQIAEVSP